MNNHFDSFKDYLKNEKHCSANTYESYIRDLEHYFYFCGENGLTDPAFADQQFLRRFFGGERMLGKSESTVNRTVASVRCYYKFLTQRGIVSSNPLEGLRVKKTAQKLPGILDSKEILLLLSQPNGKDLKSVRDKAMLELLYATGIKVSELIELRVSDVNLQVGLLYLHDKHERIIPIYPEAVRCVSEYLEDVRPVILSNPHEDRLFTNMQGGAMSRQGFWKIVKHYAATAGIEKDITPHTLRHCFAAHLLENGAQLKDIQEMLGHSDISSTQIYARFIKNKYTLAYSKFHPMAK